MAGAVGAMTPGAGSGGLVSTGCERWIESVLGRGSLALESSELDAFLITESHLAIFFIGQDFPRLTRGFGILAGRVVSVTEVYNLEENKAIESEFDDIDTLLMWTT